MINMLIFRKPLLLWCLSLKDKKAAKKKIWVNSERICYCETSQEIDVHYNSFHQNQIFIRPAKKIQKTLEDTDTPVVGRSSPVFQKYTLYIFIFLLFSFLISHYYYDGYIEWILTRKNTLVRIQLKEQHHQSQKIRFLLVSYKLTWFDTIFFLQKSIVLPAWLS